MILYLPPGTPVSFTVNEPVKKDCSRTIEMNGQRYVVLREDSRGMTISSEPITDAEFEVIE